MISCKTSAKAFKEKIHTNTCIRAYLHNVSLNSTYPHTHARARAHTRTAHTHTGTTYARACACAHTRARAHNAYHFLFLAVLNVVRARFVNYFVIPPNEIKRHMTKTKCFASPKIKSGWIQRYSSAKLLTHGAYTHQYGARF